MIDHILSKYPDDQTSLVMILQDIQAEQGYISEDSVRQVSAALRVPSARVQSVVAFYHILRTEPRGRHMIRVCVGTACHVRQAPLIHDAARRELGLNTKNTTEDGLFTLESVGCVGACALGPVVEVDHKHHGMMDARKLRRLIHRLRSAAGGQPK